VFVSVPVAVASETRNVRLLLVGAGAGFSTKDVEIGYLEAFKQLGYDVKFYALDRRI